MFVVLEKNTYAGDGCEYTGDYTVSSVIGFFNSRAEAYEYTVGKDSYSVEYEVFEVAER
jgi:hypothetical protein